MGAERGWANSEPQLTSLLELRSLEQIIFFLFYLFLVALGWVFIAVLGLSLVAVIRPTL